MREPSQLYPTYQGRELSGDLKALYWEYERDLSACGPTMLEHRWKGEERKAIELVDDFESRLKDHNPVYHVALRSWFDNQPDLLYEPLHRDKLCAALFKHKLDPTRDQVGLWVMIQRESFKTTFDHGVFPSFLAYSAYLLERKKKLRIALVHHKDFMATRNGKRLMRKHMTHPWVAEFWPEFQGKKKTDYGGAEEWDWPWAQDDSTTEVKSITCLGLDTEREGMHFDWMLFSDPVTRKHIQYRKVRENAKHAFAASLYYLDNLTGKFVVDGTMYHKHDLHNAALKTTLEGVPTYKRLVLGAGGKTAGKPLTFPTRHSEEMLERKRQIEIRERGNDDFWWLQMQNVVNMQRKVATNTDWIRHCDLGRVPLHNCLQVFFMDPAWKGTENWGEGDFAAGSLLAIERRGSLLIRYLLDGFHSNEMSNYDGEHAAFEIMQRWGARYCAPEEIGSRVFRTQMKNGGIQRGYPIQVVDLQSTNRKKPDRLASWAATVELGTFYIVDTCPRDVRDALVEQYADLTQLDHDDMIDCVAYCMDPAIIKLAPVMMPTPPFNPGRQAALRAPLSRYCMS